jgi:hypothetical protein
MKSITFGPRPQTKNYNVHDLEDQIVAFLTAHGMSERYAKEITSVKDQMDYVYVNPDCANSDYTRALALFQLIFSDTPNSSGKEKPAYIAYRPKECGMKLTVSSGFTYEDVINYIKDHMEITIA